MNYLALLLKAQSRGLIRPGAVTMAEIAHGSTCPALAGGSCRCTAEIRLISDGRVMHLDETGEVVTEEQMQ